MQTGDVNLFVRQMFILKNIISQALVHTWEMVSRKLRRNTTEKRLFCELRQIEKKDRAHSSAIVEDMAGSYGGRE